MSAAVVRRAQGRLTMSPPSCPEAYLWLQIPTFSPLSYTENRLIIGGGGIIIFLHPAPWKHSYVTEIKRKIK